MVKMSWALRVAAWGAPCSRTARRNSQHPMAANWKGLVRTAVTWVHHDASWCMVHGASLKLFQKSNGLGGVENSDAQCFKPSKEIWSTSVGLADIMPRLLRKHFSQNLFPSNSAVVGGFLPSSVRFNEVQCQTQTLQSEISTSQLLCLWIPRWRLNSSELVNFFCVISATSAECWGHSERLRKRAFKGPLKISYIMCLI